MDAELEQLKRELAALERANRELRRTNLRLARDRLATLDSAAAGAVHRRGPARPGPARRARAGIKARMRALALRILR